MSPSEHLFSAPEAAEYSDTHYQTLVSWERKGVLKPKRKRKKTRKGEGRYTLHDVVAALIIREASAIGLSDAMREMAEMIQRHDKEELARAAICTVKSESSGMMRQIWFPDCTEPGVKEFLTKMNQGKGDKKQLLSLTPMLDLVKKALEQIQKKYDADVLAQTQIETF